MCSNVVSPIFLTIALFYIQHVFCVALSALTFNLDDPYLFNQYHSLAKVGKASIDVFQDSDEKNLKKRFEDWGKKQKETSGHY